MITYETHNNVVVAKFYQDGKSLRRIWQHSLEDIYLNYIRGTDFCSSWIATELVDKVLADRKLVGIAKCHPNDEFNLEEGKRLAREDLINRFNLAKTQLKKELLYYIKHQVEIVKNRV
jgi:hypothetical protein